MRLVALLAVVLLLVACGGDDGSPGDEAAAPTAAPRNSIVIRSLGIDAPLTLKRLQVGVALPAPDSAADVAIYDFGQARGVAGPMGGAPGEGGNAVMSGRSISDVGCAPAEPPCNGVFVGLFRIALGDRIDVSWRGDEHRYQVVSVCNVPASQFTEGLYTRSAQEQTTLLTGTGSLGPSGFSHVLIVIAKRAPVTSSEPCPEGTKTGATP